MNAVDALLTALALLAALAARRGIAASEAGSVGVAGHLRQVIALVALLLALRLALLLEAFPIPAGLIVPAVLVVAAWLPLAALRLGEELVRRHAPSAVKWLALGGAIGFSVLAITLGIVWTLEAVIALAAFQALLLVAVLIHILANRGSIALAERRTADLIALAWLIAIPLVLTDFQGLMPDLPVRGGAFAAMVFVLASSRAADERGRPASLMLDIAVCAGAGLMFKATPQLLKGDLEQTFHSLFSRWQPWDWQVFATGAGLAALILLVERLVRSGRGEANLLAGLADSGDERADLLSAHPLLATSIPIVATDTADFPEGTMELLAQRRVIAAEDPGLEEHLRAPACELLGRYAASHLVRIATDPPRFIAVSGGSLAGRRLTVELEIAARLLEKAQ